MQNRLRYCVCPVSINGQICKHTKEFAYPSWLGWSSRKKLSRKNYPQCVVWTVRFTVLFVLLIILRNAMNLQNRSRHTYGAGLNDMQILNNKYLKSCEPLHLECNDSVVWEYTLAQSKVTDSIPVQIGSHILSLSKLHLLKVRYSFVIIFYHFS